MEQTWLQTVQFMAEENAENKEFTESLLKLVCSYGSAEDVKAFVEKKGPFPSELLQEYLYFNTLNFETAKYLLSIDPNLVYQAYHGHLLSSFSTEKKEEQVLDFLIYLLENGRSDISDVTADNFIQRAIQGGHLQVATYLINRYKENISSFTFSYFLNHCLSLADKKAFAKMVSH